MNHEINNNQGTGYASLVSKKAANKVPFHLYPIGGDSKHKAIFVRKENEKN